MDRRWSKPKGEAAPADEPQIFTVLEIVCAGVDKGRAVGYLQRLLGYEPSQTVVAGDSPNDLPSELASLAQPLPPVHREGGREGERRKRDERERRKSDERDERNEREREREGE